MFNTTVTLKLIGMLRTPHRTVEGMPIQPSGAEQIEGVAELFPGYALGLTDLDGFSHAILLYHLHEVKSFKLSVKPFMDTVEHGVFATRSPCRPALVGLSIVRVKRVENGQLVFTGADMLNGSPLIDIKPFFGPADNQPDAVNGWLETRSKTLVSTQRSDTRFMEQEIVK